jgi:UDP:flavonoid glycosyltransferase YjiC (YdhE family)
LFTSHIPHAWLFPQAAAVIHHGGLGTTPAALRWGCPMAVEPMAFDQFLNALHIRNLGVGAAMDQGKLTAQGLASVLQERVLAPAVQERAAAVAARIQQENGLTTACDLIEQWSGS